MKGCSLESGIGMQAEELKIEKILFEFLIRLVNRDSHPYLLIHCL